MHMLGHARNKKKTFNHLPLQFIIENRNRKQSKNSYSLIVGPSPTMFTFETSFMGEGMNNWDILEDIDEWSGKSVSLT